MPNVRVRTRDPHSRGKARATRKEDQAFRKIRTHGQVKVASMGHDPLAGYTSRPRVRTEVWRRSEG